MVLPFPLISSDLKIWMEREFEEEIFRALVDCEFVMETMPQIQMGSISFMREAWDIINEGFSLMCC